MKKLLFISVFTLIAGSANAQTFYKCFDSDSGGKMKITVKYVNETAVSVKYKGQKQAIPLNFVKQIVNKEDSDSGLTSLYNEKYNGKVTGKYLITHSGNYDYVEYHRQAGEVFNFTLNQDLSLVNNSYRKTACY